jgi:hypothetical protein
MAMFNGKAALTKGQQAISPLMSVCTIYGWYFLETKASKQQTATATQMQVCT